MHNKNIKKLNRISIKTNKLLIIKQFINIYQDNTIYEILLLYLDEIATKGSDIKVT